MTQFRRRSWGSAGPPRNQGLRLSTMIALLIVVVVLIIAADRPAIWSHLVPNLDQRAPTHPPGPAAQIEIRDHPRTAQPPPANRQSPLFLAGLIAAAVAYGAWRITRIVRAIAGRAESRAKPNRLVPGSRTNQFTSEAPEAPPHDVPRPENAPKDST